MGSAAPSPSAPLQASFCGCPGKHLVRINLATRTQLSHIAGGNADWKTVWQFLVNLSI